MNFVDDSENRRTENKENRTGYRVRATWIILGTYQQYTYLPRQVKKKKYHTSEKEYTQYIQDIMYLLWEAVILKDSRVDKLCIIIYSCQI